MTAFELARFEAERDARQLTLGQRVTWSAETGSTNDDALAAARSGAPHGALFGAESQTRGRGRRGSEWLSAPGEGLWFSVLLRPELAPEVAPGLALCAGLAVREAAAARVSAPVQVKWPNDVWAGGKKLCGILVESQLSGSKLSSAIIGIGVNVAQATFPEPLAEIATSLRAQGAADTRREALLADVLGALERELRRLAAGGMAALADQLRPHDALLGKRLRVEGRAGVGAGIDSAGRLLLRTDTAQIEITSGHVEVRS